MEKRWLPKGLNSATAWYNVAAHGNKNQMKDYSQLQASSFLLNSIQDNASNMSSLAHLIKEYPFSPLLHFHLSKIVQV